jgi:hypothetical protein
MGDVWKSLKEEARESLECYKQNLMGDSGGCLEDQNANKHVDSKDC